MQRFIFRAAAVAAAVAMFAAGALVFQGCGDDTVKPNDQFTDDPYNPPNVVTDGKSADELIADGYGVLMAGDGSIGSVDFDEAFAYFEAAYKKDPNNVQAVAVSSLAKIASSVSIPRSRRCSRSTSGSRSILTPSTPWLTLRGG